MQCEQARQALSETRYATERPPELEAHLATCEACSSLFARELALDRFLALDEPAAVRPGFDTRFFARLGAEKQRASSRRRMRWLWALVPAAAGAAFVLLRPIPTPISGTPASTGIEVAPGDLPLAMELDLIENVEVVKKLDEVEAYEVLSQLDEGELERLAQERP
jgi:predicted anti-sigma-YlaC factor YlaD